jgi:hypothetical protein
MKILKLTLIASVAILALGHAPADAGREQARSRTRQAAGFNVAGTYSGALSGTILVGGEMVVIPKKVTIIDTNGRTLKPGTSVSGRGLYVSGRMQDGDRVAGFIVVSDPSSKSDFSQQTLPNMEADPNRAR